MLFLFPPMLSLFPPCYPYFPHVILIFLLYSYQTCPIYQTYQICPIYQTYQICLIYQTCQSYHLSDFIINNVTTNLPVLSDIADLNNNSRQIYYTCPPYQTYQTYQTYKYDQKNCATFKNKFKKFSHIIF